MVICSNPNTHDSLMRDTCWLNSNVTPRTVTCHVLPTTTVLFQGRRTEFVLRLDLVSCTPVCGIVWSCFYSFSFGC